LKLFEKKSKKRTEKLKWKDDYAEGTIKKIGKDILYRYTSSKVGSTFTKTYKLFNKKGEIVTYTFVYDK